MNDDDYEDDEDFEDDVDYNKADDTDSADSEDGDDDGDYEDDEANSVSAPTATAVLDYLARQVVDDPDSVEVDVDDSRRTVQLSVSVAPDDMGRVIGKRGRVANAIRTVVRAAAAKDGIEVDVEFVD